MVASIRILSGGPRHRVRHISLVLVAAAVALIVAAIGPAGAQARDIGTVPAQSSGEPGLLIPVTPTRLLDTRTGNGAPQTRLTPGATLTVTYAGRTPIPTNAAAVLAAVTIATPTATGFLTINATGSTAKATIANYSAHTGITSTAVLPLSHTTNTIGNGSVTFTNNSPGTIDLITDITGYYTAGTPTAAGALNTVTPTRLLDTRTGNGAPQTRLTPGATLTVTYAGRTPIPTNAAAVLAAVTIATPTATGFLTINATGSTAKATIANYSAHTGITSTAVLPLSHTTDTNTIGNGSVTFTNNSPGTIDLITDITGYYTAGTPTAAGALNTVTPTRLLDTRTGNGAPQTRLTPGATLTVTYAGRTPIPTNAAAVLAAVTIATPTATGFLTINATGSTAKATIANYSAHTGITSTAVLPLSHTTDTNTGGNTDTGDTIENGSVTFTNNSPGTIDLIIDITGYYWAAGLTVDSRSAPLPADALAAAPAGEILNGNLADVSCGSSRCVAVGSYTTDDGPVGLIDTFTGSGWQPSPAPAPPASGSVTRLGAVSCTGEMCAAAGSSDTAGIPGGVLLLSRDGQWTTTMAAAPQNAPAGAGQSVNLSSVACPTTEFCVAVGNYSYAGQQFGLLETYTGTGWVASKAPELSDSAAATQLTAVSCVGPGECVAVGTYATSGGATKGVLVTLSGTAWTAGAAPVPTDSAPSIFVALNQVHCSGEQCIAVGSYSLSNTFGDERVQGLVLTKPAGTTKWSAAASPVPGPANDIPPRNALTDISCLPSSCFAVGQFRASKSDTAPLLEDFTNPISTSLSLTLPSDYAAAYGQAQLTTTGCSSTVLCLAAGRYSTNDGWPGLLAARTGPSWTTLRAPSAAGTADGVTTNFQAVACLPDTCFAVGDFTDTANDNIGLITTVLLR